MCSGRMPSTVGVRCAVVVVRGRPHALREALDRRQEDETDRGRAAKREPPTSGLKNTPQTQVFMFFFSAKLLSLTSYESYIGTETGHTLRF